MMSLKSRAWNGLFQPGLGKHPTSLTENEEKVPFVAKACRKNVPLGLFDEKPSNFTTSEGAWQSQEPLGRPASMYNIKFFQKKNYNGYKLFFIQINSYLQ